MGIGTAETVQGADERALEAAYAEAAMHWLEVPLEQVSSPDWTDEPGDTGVDQRAHAGMESASAYQLGARFEGVASSESRRSRTVADTLTLLRAADRLASWAAARQALLIAEVFSHMHKRGGIAPGNLGQDRSDPNLGFTVAVQEIAPLLRVPGRTAQRMLGEALRLTEELPGTWDALEAGVISPVQAQVIVEESGSIPAEAVAGFESKVLETAGALTRPKLTRRCRRLREELHPESITVRKERVLKDRDVSVQAEQDGMAWLGAYLPAEQAHGIFNRVDAAARSLQGPGEPRTLSQLRADVFADVLTHTCAGDPKKGTGFRGVGASVFVTVPVMTLLGHHRADWQNRGEGAAVDLRADDVNRASPEVLNGDAPGADTTAPGVVSDAPGVEVTAPGVEGVPTGTEGCENGLLDGYGPIDPDTARRLAAHAPSFTRILVHPETGAVLSVGRNRYRPPKHLQDWARITNPTFIHPGCNRSSWTCELDHVTPWAHGGRTELQNLKPRCKVHHMLKTEGIWTTGQNEHGTQHVTSPGGETYTTHPEPPPPF